MIGFQLEQLGERVEPMVGEVVGVGQEVGDWVVVEEA
jgi:hypothetical protein